MEDEEESTMDNGWPGQMLHQAVLYNNTDLMVCLLEGDEKKNLNSQDMMGRTCVYTAVSNNSDACLQFLLNIGADANIPAGKRYNSMTPLHSAICDNKFGAIKILLAHNADIYTSDDSGSTPLSLAKVLGNRDICKMLEDEIERRKVQLSKTAECLHEAIINKNVENVKDILQLSGINNKRLLKFVPENATPLLCSAAQVGNVEILSALLRAGATPVVDPMTALSPLHYACEKGHNSVLQLLLKQFPEFSNSLSASHELPLHFAVAIGKLDVVQSLLHHAYPLHVLDTYEIGQMKYKAPFDVNSVNSNGMTPLHIACEKGHTGIVKELLQFSVFAETEEYSNGHGMTPSASFQSLSSEYQSMNDFNTLQPQIHPVNIDALTSEGLAPLHIAIKHRHYDIMETLTASCADLNIVIKKDNQPRSLILYTIEISDCKMLNILLSRDVEDIDNKGLRYAIHRNQVDHVILLLQYKSSKCHNHSIKRSELRRAYSQMHYYESAEPISVDSLNDKPMTTAVSLNLQGLKLLNYLPEDCILGASLRYNSFLATCDKQMILCAITKIDLSENSFDNFPLILFELPSLCVLNMSFNEVADFPSDEDFAENVQCFALEEINLQRNQIAMIPAYFFKLPVLKFLNLSQNKLAELPIEVWTAPSLIHLNCTQNKLKCLPYTPWDEVFLKSGQHSGGNLSSSLQMNPRSYSGTSSDEWMSFERRSEANISDSLAPQDVMENEVVHINHWSSKITVIDDDANLNNSDKGLRKLELGKNLFKEVPQCLACCAPNLKYLDISMNPLLSVGSLSDLPVNLQELNLSWTGLSDLKPWIYSSEVTSDDQPCYSSEVKPLNSSRPPTYNKSSPSLSSRDSYSGQSSVLQSAYCPHRHHTQLQQLEKLNLSFNKLKTVELLKPTLKDGASSESTSLSSLGLESEDIHTRLLFPHLSELDLSSNHLNNIPPEIGDMTELKVLILNKNVYLKELPPKLGLLKQLWKLELELCPLDGTIQDMMRTSRYPVKDILGFLLSILEESTEYNSMNLMFVGSHKMGKTSLLDRMRKEGKSSTVATRDTPRIKKWGSLGRNNSFSIHQGRSRTRSELPGVHYTHTSRRNTFMHASLRIDDFEGHWRDRVSDKPTNIGGRKGEVLSTVGIDINDLVIDRRSKGSVHFRTWDFGGQREYYATHQYFLSPRSLYLVIWNIIEGEKGVESLLQWLINIQARAPGTSVIIVGTHLDVLKDKLTKRNYPPDFEEAMTDYIFKTFINEQEPDKSGLPLIRDVINISSKTGENVKRLVDSIYENAFDLHHPKVKTQKLLKQKIPKKYLLLQDVVRELARERILEHKDPVLIKSKYILCVSNKMIEKAEKTFRDVEELGQATRFLHENGVLFHYEDLPLRDLYFLDPQWLCDQLAKVITVREVNTFAPRGIMEMEKLKFLFKSTAFKHDNIENYITNLLGKFEVALQFDEKNLILPSLLPKEEEIRDCILHNTDIRIPLRRNQEGSVCVHNDEREKKSPMHYPAFTAYRPPPPKVINVGKSKFYTGPNSPGTPINDESQFVTLKLKPSSNPIFSYTRLYFMTYIPSGFWPRLITRVLADSTLFEICQKMFPIPADLLGSSIEVRMLSESSPDWRCWQTGLELLHYGFEIMRIREITMNSPVGVCDYNECRIKCSVDSEWSFLDIYRSKILEITFPTDSLTFHVSNQEGLQIQLQEVSKTTTVLRDDSVTAKLLVKIVEHVDNLLQDWYPELGELRFHQTCEGRYLVTRVVLCPQCLHEEVTRQKTTCRPDAWYFLDPDRPEVRATRIGLDEPVIKSRKSVDVNHVEMNGVEESLKEGQSMFYNKPQEEGIIYSFFVERCMLDCLEGLDECCPLHGSISPAHMIDTSGVCRMFYLAPDVVFHDLASDLLITQTDILVQGQYLGKGTFGDVYAGALSRKGEGPSVPVAMKILFTYSKFHNMHQGVQGRLDRASQAYLVARQEVSILESLIHPYIVPLLGLQCHPLCLVLKLAPLGALDHHLRDLNNTGGLLPLFVIRKVILQIAEAVAYLHSNNVIYRDLKSENVLVWALPTSMDAKPSSPVDVKIADYGISRAVLPFGAKGFGGTPPFIAPEILQHAGKDMYTEKVDIFSFGMFMYELITCRLPLIEINNPNSYICQGGRPNLTTQDVNKYPTYMLDVMTTSWSHDPCDRPSAQDIVTIATSPQFLHLRDVVGLGPDVGILCGMAVPCEETKTMLSSLYDEEDTIDKNICNHIWLSTNHSTGCSIEVLGFNQYHHCLTSKTVSVSGTDVTAICLVEDLVWCADTKGFITIICSKSHKLLKQFTLPITIVSDVFIIGLNYFHQLEKVIAVLQSGEIFILNTQHNGQLRNMNIEVYKTDISLCSTQVADSRRNELWLGQGRGVISIWDVTKCCIIKQLNTSTTNKLPVGTYCMFMIAAQCNEDISVWSYNYPGSEILRWSTVNRIIMNKLDLSQLTFTSSNTDVSKSQVTAMNIQDRYLYIGTTSGSIIITDANTLQTYNIITPHVDTEFYIKCLLPLTPSESSSVEGEQVAQYPGIISVGKGYKDMIKVSTEIPDVMATSLLSTGKELPNYKDPLLNHTFLTSLDSSNWEYY